MKCVELISLKIILLPLHILTILIILSIKLYIEEQKGTNIFKLFTRTTNISFCDFFRFFFFQPTTKHNQDLKSYCMLCMMLYITLVLWLLLPYIPLVCMQVLLCMYDLNLDCPDIRFFMFYILTNRMNICFCQHYFKNFAKKKIKSLMSVCPNKQYISKIGNVIFFENLSRVS